MVAESNTVLEILTGRPLNMCRPGTPLFNYLLTISLLFPNIYTQSRTEQDLVTNPEFLSRFLPCGHSYRRNQLLVGVARYSLCRTWSSCHYQYTLYQAIRDAGGSRKRPKEQVRRSCLYLARFITNKQHATYSAHLNSNNKVVRTIFRKRFTLPQRRSGRKAGSQSWTLFLRLATCSLLINKQKSRQ